MAEQHVWSDTRIASRMRPINYKPNGSFRELKNKGKLVDPSQMDAVGTRDLGAAPQEESKFIPGYTGYIRGSQHIRGRTYGETTKRAATTDYRDLACSSPVPSSPQNSRKIEQEPLTHTFVGNNFTNKAYHVPGYTGFVPGTRTTFGRSYGTATTEQLSLTAGTRSLDNGNRAGPMKAHRQIELSSAPLPGAPKTEVAPVFLVPSTVRHLKYISS